MFWRQMTLFRYWMHMSISKLLQKAAFTVVAGKSSLRLYSIHNARIACCFRTTTKDREPRYLLLSRGRGTHHHVRGPKGEIVSQELHDECAVLVWLLAQCIQLCNGLVKGLQRMWNTWVSQTWEVYEWRVLHGFIATFVRSWALRPGLRAMLYALMLKAASEGDEMLNVSPLNFQVVQLRRFFLPLSAAGYQDNDVCDYYQDEILIFSYHHKRMWLMHNDLMKFAMGWR